MVDNTRVGAFSAGMSNLLTEEMKKHLCVAELIYDAGPPSDKVFPLDGVDEEWQRSTVAILRDVCRGYYILSKLRIYPGDLPLKDSYYWRPTGAESIRGGISILVANPKLSIHLVNCPCIRKMGVCKCAERDDDPWDGEGAPPLEGWEHVQTDKPEALRTKEGCMEHDCNSRACASKLTAFIERLIQTHRPLSSSNEPSYVLDSDDDDRSRYPLWEMHRLLKNEVCFDGIMTHFGWSTPNLDGLDFSTWCNCPCQLKVYAPNDLDIQVVDICLRGTFGAYYLSGTGAGEYLESIASRRGTERDHDPCTMGKIRACMRAVERDVIQSMLHRMLTRCRKIYVELSAKVRCLIRVYKRYVHPDEDEADDSGHGEPTQMDRCSRDLKEIVQYFNWSFLHHIVPTEGSRCLASSKGY